ncbi:MAG: dTDP-4-dehydrorhamnose 3,5-epimerase [Candidatus Neomarinimicrobiota bacterium]
MKVEKTPLNDAFILTPKAYRDARGFLMESYRKDIFRQELGIDPEFVQDIHSRSMKHVLRGLHFQWDPAMGKLMRVTIGKAFLVAVDIRKGSPTSGGWFGIEASAENRKQVWAPAGFARGFCALSEVVEVQYKCTGIYNPACESGLRWNDPEIGIKWPVAEPILSDKDRNAQTLAQWLARPESEHFKF